ncbi:hypothetical protein BDF19DRAFT_438552 [Syncephalis fuscata]|nr:hypothetical protein BDF19DRAFT_438552 [Syncephalis fuscata]
MPEENTQASLATLPGSQRRVHTALQEYARSRRHWLSIREECFTLLTQLSNTAIQLDYANYEECWHPGLMPFRDVREKYRIKQNEKLLMEKEKADISFSKLERQYERMNSQIKFLQQLQTDLTARLGKERVITTPVLLTLTLATLITRLSTVVEQHRKQLVLDRQLIEQLAKAQTRDAATLQLSAWLNVPNMDANGVCCQLDELLELELTPIV